MLRIQYFQLESSPDYTGGEIFETYIPGGNEKILQPKMIKWLTVMFKEEYAKW